MVIFISKQNKNTRISLCDGDTTYICYLYILTRAVSLTKVIMSQTNFFQFIIAVNDSDAVGSSNSKMESVNFFLLFKNYLRQDFV